MSDTALWPDPTTLLVGYLSLLCPFRTWFSLRYFVGLVLSVLLLNVVSLQYLEQQAPKEHTGFCAMGQEMLDASWLSPLLPTQIPSCSDAVSFASDGALLLSMFVLYMALVLLHLVGFFCHRYRKKS